MVCKYCGSSNVSTQMITESKLVNKHHGVIWWCCIGWWWFFVKWLVFTVPALILALFGSKKQKLKQKHYTMCVCQDCGKSWKR